MGVKRSLCACAAAVAVAALLLGCERSASRKRAKVKDVSPPSGRQVTCPVSGKAVDGNFCTVHLGTCIYFCSKRCVSEFAKEPEKYLKKLDEQGVVLNDASSCEHLER